MTDDLVRVELEEDLQGATLSGELDLAAYEKAQSALAPLFDASGEVILDCSELSFIDSSGIRLFIRLHQALGERGGLVVRSAQPHVVRVLEIAGLPQLGIRLEGVAE